MTTPGFRHASITRAKKEGTVIETVKESIEDGIPSYRLFVPGHNYEWYVHKSETVLVRKPTLVISKSDYESKNK